MCACMSFHLNTHLLPYVISCLPLSHTVYRPRRNVILQHNLALHLGIYRGRTLVTRGRAMLVGFGTSVSSEHAVPDMQ